MRKAGWIGGALLALAALGAWAALRPPAPLDAAAFRALYRVPLPPLSGPGAVYHLGHSLVGRDMPAMLAQLGGHDHASQLGWGASLNDHRRGTIKGFAEENAHPAFRPAEEALQGGGWPVVVLTEMVELKDAIRYHDSARALAHWAALARAARPDVRIYLYETWHRLDDPAGWRQRLSDDLPALWEGALLRPAMARAGVGTIHVIPGGQVMAAVDDAARAGQIPGMTSAAALFSDEIHLNDLGAWLIAMTHDAVIRGRSPVGLPAALRRADGTAATPPAPETARALQEVVWRVVTSYPATGVAQAR